MTFILQSLPLRQSMEPLQSWHHNSSNSTRENIAEQMNKKKSWRKKKSFTQKSQDGENLGKENDKNFSSNRNQQTSKIGIKGQRNEFQYNRNGLSTAPVLAPFYCSRRQESTPKSSPYVFQIQLKDIEKSMEFYRQVPFLYKQQRDKRLDKELEAIYMNAAISLGNSTQKPC